MTTLETLHKQITTEKKRIELVKKSYTLNKIDYEFANNEVKRATEKIISLQKQLDDEYNFQNQ